MWTSIVVFVLLMAGHRELVSGNSLRGIVHHACPDKQVVSQINSSYSSIDQDRQWKIGCKTFGPTSDCSWSSPQDLYDKELSYHCPLNHVVAGISSYFSSAHGDRSWKVLCCSAPNLITFECRETPLVNYLTEDFSWQLPADHFLTGLQTHRKNSDNGDRRWIFSYCKGTTKDTNTINSKILTLNQDIIDHLIEGDVFVSSAKNARKCPDCRWPKSGLLVQVPYAVSNSFASSEKITIDDAISAFHMTTCVRFVPRTDQTDYVSIVKEQGCWSWVGRTGGSQALSLGTECILKGIIEHELIHALGFWHEQSRSDRDAYVRINRANIQDGLIRNFDKLDTNNLAVPYDYSSVMHYAPRDFAKNSREFTIIPLDTKAQIGQRDGMSGNDIVKINKLYKCEEYLHKYGEWDNELKNTFTRMCPTGQAVSGFTSLYNNKEKDRLWAFSCKAFKIAPTCKWSTAVSRFWHGLNFRCGDNEVIAGVKSTFIDHFNDRQWQFYCCSNPGFTMSNCQKATGINDYKEYFSWTVASDHFLTGVESSFDRDTCDRRWTLTYCQGNTQ